MGYLHNENVPSHRVKIRSDNLFRAVDYHFRTYKEALEKNGYDCNILRFDKIGDHEIGLVHAYITEVRKLKNKTINNFMSQMSTFTSHVKKQFYPNYTNPFLGVPRKPLTKRIVSIDEDEFVELLKVVTPENGATRIRRTKEKTQAINFYRPWMKQAFLLGIFTGGRQEEIVELRWSGITYNKDGTPFKLNVEHFKTNRQKGLYDKDEGKEIKDFVITEELMELLVSLGYEENKNSNEYIIAPEKVPAKINGTRKSLGALISRAFSHYYGLLKTNKSVYFSDLRKTYITAAIMQYGLGANALSKHKTVQIMDIHYHDKEKTKKHAQKHFRVFSKE